ncbi:MAG: hypothetical protein K2H20_04870 [Bacilli bacterium]|nr:hypothetical protein [Bacilli bacterium]
MNNQNTKKEQQNQEIVENEKVTITPTMLDESEDKIEKKRDLSSIIPKFEDNTNDNNSIELISQEKALKGDGAISIALINGDGDISLTPNATLPNPIDIEERKKEKQKNKNGKNKKVKKKNKSSQKIQNTTALVSLVVIIFLIGFWFWYKNHPTDEDFQPINVTVEIGDSLPIRTSSYVKPGVGKEIEDELQYAIDLSKIVLEEVGDYEFTVTYKGITKTGKVSIVDTTPPEIEIRNVKINEGDTYTAGSFVESCKDPNGCNYSFQDAETEKKYTTSGAYVVYVVATDAFQNSVTKKASLIIEAQGKLKEYYKATAFDFNTGYELTEKYSLRFEEYSNYSLLLSGTHEKIFQYQDEEVYEKAAKIYSGEVNYICDDSKKIITFRESVTTVGSNYSRLEEIDPYLKREGFYEN